MEALDKMYDWADRHQTTALDVLRVLTGAFIFYKGLYFMQHSNYILELTAPFFGEAFTSFWVVHYVAMAHLAGGVMIAIGLLTRIAVIAQLPVLVGAVVIHFISQFQVMELIQSLIILLMLLTYTVYGSGGHSADAFLGIGKRNKR